MPIDRDPQHMRTRRCRLIHNACDLVGEPIRHDRSRRRRHATTLSTISPRQRTEPMGREAQVGEWAGRPFAERGAGTAWTPERPPFDRGDEDGGCDWDRACDWDVEVSADRP